jgi:hypothetical protein
VKENPPMVTVFPEDHQGYNKFLTLLQTCLSYFAQEQTDPPTSEQAIKLAESALSRRMNLNPANITFGELSMFLQDLVEMLEEEKEKIATLSVEALQALALDYMRQYFENQQVATQKQYFNVKPHPLQSFNTEVNDIIMKVELRKFKNLLSQKAKNPLLQSDCTRLYPLSFSKPKVTRADMYVSHSANF